jgi:TetR/AcrR family transcriptional regulator, repressor of fatR-cypB operon
VADARTRKQSTRDRILRAALTLFAERGFHGTAVPLVAQTAGVGAGSIYRHFPSKDALVNAVFQDVKRRLGAALSAHLALDAAPRAQFAQLWIALAEFVAADPEGFAFVELHHHQPYLDAESRALELQVLGPLVELVLRAIQAGVLRPGPPEITLSLVWGAFVGLVKSARAGYLSLDAATLATAEAACWRLLAPDERS